MDISTLSKELEQQMANLQEEQRAYFAKNQITDASSDGERLAVFGAFLQGNTSLDTVLAQAKEITGRCVKSIEKNIKPDAGQGRDSKLRKAQDPSVDISERIDILGQLIEELEQPEDRKPVILCLAKIMGDPKVADQHKENASDILFDEFVEATSSDMLARLNELMEIKECKQLAALFLINMMAEGEKFPLKELGDSLRNAFNIVYETWSDDSQIKIDEHFLLNSLECASHLINSDDYRGLVSDFLLKMLSRKDLSNDTRARVLEILVDDFILVLSDGHKFDLKPIFKVFIDLMQSDDLRDRSVHLFFKILFESDIMENNIPVETLTEVMDILVKAELAKPEEDDESYVLIQEVGVLSDMVRKNKHKDFALGYLMKIVDNPRLNVHQLMPVAKTLNKGGDTDKAIELFWRIFNHANTAGWLRASVRDNLIQAGVDASKIDKACLDLIKCESFSVDGKNDLIDLLASDVNKALAFYEILKDSSLVTDDKRGLRADFIYYAQKAIGSLGNKELIVKLEGLLAEVLFACITQQSESWNLNLWLPALEDLNGHADKYAQALLSLVKNSDLEAWNRMRYIGDLQALKDQEDLALQGVFALLADEKIDAGDKQELTEIITEMGCERLIDIHNQLNKYGNGSEETRDRVDALDLAVVALAEMAGPGEHANKNVQAYARGALIDALIYAVEDPSMDSMFRSTKADILMQRIPALSSEDERAGLLTRIIYAGGVSAGMKRRAAEILGKIKGYKDTAKYILEQLK